MYKSTSRRFQTLRPKAPSSSSPYAYSFLPNYWKNWDVLILSEEVLDLLVLLIHLSRILEVLELAAATSWIVLAYRFDGIF